MKPAIELFIELQERIILLEKRLASLEGKALLEGKDNETKKSPGRPRREEAVDA